ncbi:MAG: S1 RNA-binding domain-containing protein [Polyangiaceae bacterium]|nr:S1 RNA-binding domain-containing protein [Polyangiaceae bacterium]
MSIDNDDDENFAALFEREAGAQNTRNTRKQRRVPRVGERLEGVVVQVGRDAVFVELDGKLQALLEADEVREPDGSIALSEGDKITAHVVEVDEKSGVVRLGRSMGKAASLAALEQAMAAGLGVDGKVTASNKGGIEVDLGTARAFCPMSQIDDKRVGDADIQALLGQTLQFLVTAIRDGKSVVVSRRAFLQKQAAELAERAMSQITPGAVLTGTVTSLRDFGAFVDLGGVEGLIPRTEIAHDRSLSVGDALKAGDTVEVQVLQVKDSEASEANATKATRATRPESASTKKITLSLKALAVDPWAELSIVEGRVILGTVTRLAEFGAFVRIASGVEGLVHVSELGRRTPTPNAPGAPSAMPSEGDEMRVVVSKIDRVSRKISLVPAPDGAEVGTTIVTNAQVRVGAIVSGVVERIEQYGLFVQIDGTTGRGGRGLVPIAEIGVARGTDLRKAFPIGTAVTTKVLETGEGRLRLSIRGAKDAEERAAFEAARGKASAPASLGTFADLLKGRRL